jgi:hypothetical protein
MDRLLLLIAVVPLFAACAGAAESNLRQPALPPFFVLGCYENPGSTSGLQELKEAGFNLVRCGANRDQLDQVQAAGLHAWVSLGSNLDLSSDREKRQAQLTQWAQSLRDHPALLAWEGPDEPAYQIYGPGLFDQAVPPDDPQRLELVAKAEEAEKSVARGLTEGYEFLKRLDPEHPVWINHAPRHTIATVSRFMPALDIVSMDIYPVPEGCGHSDLPNENLSVVGQYVDRLRQACTPEVRRAGPGKVIWMVLQGFSWAQIGIRDVRRDVVYPSFHQSRFMAYDAILHGASGILYWGTHTVRRPSTPLPSARAQGEGGVALPEPSGATLSQPKGHPSPFWDSLKALVSELNSLQPALTGSEAPGQPKVEPLGAWHSVALGAQASLRQVGEDWYMLLVNEERYSVDIQVSGLRQLEGKELFVLYEDRSEKVKDGGFRASLSPYDVQVYATSRALEAPRKGRDFRQ